MFDPKHKATEAILGHMGTLSSALRRQRLMAKLHPKPEHESAPAPVDAGLGEAAPNSEDEAMEKLKALLGH